jgi:sporulation protein YlmC with PRC-barrel domain
MPINQSQRRNIMDTFIIRRRNAWKNVQELEATAGVSLRIGNDEMADQIRWIRSYVIHETDGTLGTVCVYQATSTDAIREHAKRVGMPANEITPVAKTVIIRDDPIETEEAA